MTHLRRWSEKGAASELECAVLRSELAYAPPRGAEAQVWLGLMGALGFPPGGSDGGAGSPAERRPETTTQPPHEPQATPSAATSATPGTGVIATGSAGTAAFIKGVAVGVSLTLVAVGIFRSVSGAEDSAVAVAAPSSAHPEMPSPAALPRSDVAPSPPQANAAPAHAVETTPGDAVATTNTKHNRRRVTASAAPLPDSAEVQPEAVTSSELPLEPKPELAVSLEKPAAPAPKVSQLQREAELLGFARRQLKAGHLGAAARALGQSRREFPRSVLQQEREALSIELLFRSGSRSSAAQRARTFLEEFPNSPHREQVRELLKEHAAGRATRLGGPRVVDPKPE